MSHVVSSQCEDGDLSENSLNLHISADGNNAVWHRSDSNCGWEGNTMRFAEVERFQLPRPALCIGGILKMELLRRVHKNHVDGLHSVLYTRENAVDNFRAGKTWILIATGVVDRGMDFKGLNCVINYDFPESDSTYIHRVGRCDRAGRQGEAITLYTKEDVPFFRNIANVMAQSGGEVPSWIMSMRKTKWKRHTPKRASMSVGRRDEHYLQIN